MVIAYVPTARSSLEWAASKTSGVVSELSLLTPIIPGRVPGERRTYEERLRDHLQSLQRREAASVPSFVRPITSIHYARWLILRPEQYLQYSDVPGIRYVEDRLPPAAPQEGDAEPSTATRGLQHTPEALDDYREFPAGGAPGPDEAKRPRLLSWLLFVVTFDGDLKSYVRHVVQTIREDVDRVWGNCYGYPGARDFDQFWLYARRHQINTDVFYAAYPSLTVPKVQQLRVFKDRFDEFIARTRNPDGTSREDIGPLLDEFLRANMQYSADFPAPGGTYDETQGDRVKGRLK
ncbi:MULTISPECIES: hypothetical protein [Rhodomicrobium]|uniref:hypothetical protein n=1 Tax=Rhodomicrobium TaxID=1068 RepID=UPI000F7360C4|nr:MULTISPECIES: hypothetical protein [Rhodomicrobium]